MQFKDMLNRVHFKRLSLDKQTRLVEDLTYIDTTIVVEDASNFDIPNPAINKPGIIEIRGERIEYFTINGNVLGQLRRGTLGTGTPRVHRSGAYVQDIGSSETIPYLEENTTETIVSDGTNIVPVTFVPTVSSSSTLAWFTEYGYNYTGDYISTIAYKINDLVIYNNAYYVNIKSSTAVTPTNTTYWKLFDFGIPPGYGQNNDVEVFVGGIRLKKKPYKVYDVSLGPDSPSADVQFDAEFSTNGTDSEIRLTDSVPFGTTISVVTRTGTSWDQLINIQNDDSAIAKFLKAKPGIWYSSTGKYPDGQSTFDSGTGTFDSDSITFDQG